MAEDDAPLHVLVEIPKGSRNKYEYYEGLKAIKLDRYLFSSVVYPTDYGFIPETWALDDDPLEQPEGKDVTVDGWYPREDALEEISRARGRWADREQ